jgi:inner membrane transporter RhtA
VGITSSVIPYACDQLAMARLPRATFALFLALLPATATLVGVLVLRQIPTGVELLGIALVAGGVSVHRIPQDVRENAAPARREGSVFVRAKADRGDHP